MHGTIGLLFGLFICQTAIGQKITVEIKPSDDVLDYLDDPRNNLIQVVLNEDNDEHIIDLLTFKVDGKPPSANARIDCTLFGSEDCHYVNPVITNDKIKINAIDFEKYSALLLTLSDQHAKYDIYVNVKNKNDEDPSLILSSCNIMENNQESKCKLTVSDADGSLNDLKFSIQNSNIGDKDGFSAEECFQIDKISVGERIQTTETTLSLIKPLDFEVHTFYTFNVIVHDGERPKIFLFSFTVTVGDDNDTPPEWITTNFNFRIEEEKEEGYTFNIQARDGDYGLNNEIEYIIEENDFATINSTTGEIIMEKIDRDILSNDEIQLELIAREKTDTTSNITETLQIVVLDIDDNSAEFDKPLYELQFDEGITTEIEELNIIAKDIDSENNAVYTIEITNPSPGVEQAFDFFPKKGQEETSIEIIVKDVKLLDFEKYQSFSFTLQSKGENNSTKIATTNISIVLNDVNDELPKFKQESYSLEIFENASIDSVLISIQATDADAEDINLKHEITGLLKDALKIEEYGGKITIIKEKPFDYERQQEEYIQIQAIDKANHKAIVLLTIFVKDINDEPPKFVKTSLSSIAENSGNDTLVGTVQASDVDTTADLEMKINWESTTTTKNGNNVDISNYKGFLNLEVISNDPKNIEANIKLNEVIPSNTPDFELFDTVHLVLQVIDKKTEEGNNMVETTMIIDIKNLNDNKPEFDSSQNKFQVVENSPAATLVGVIVATDADNLQKLNYTLTFQNDQDKQWIQFDDNTGQLHTTDKPIDCDNPPRENIKFTVTASDGELESDPFEVTLTIIDQNDNAPTLDADMTTIEEDFYGQDSTNNGTVIFTLNVEDKDRDDKYNAKSVHCSILNDKQTNNYFAIKNDTEVYVDLKDGMTLDRELIEEHKITIQCFDNKDGDVQLAILRPPEFTVTLNDVNDWIPTILPTEDVLIDESVKQDATIPNTIRAEDKDKDENGAVIYTLTEVRKCDETRNECTTLDESNNMFSLTDLNNNDKSVQLKVNRDLETLYGKYEVDIKVEDKGETPLSSNSTINVEVQKYNFKAPVITYPDIEELLPSTVQEKGSPLKDSFGNEFPKLIATDGQGEKYQFDFKIYSPDLENLIKVEVIDSEGTLIWIGEEIPSENIEYKMDITATIINAPNIDGQQPLTVTNSYKVSFLSVRNLKVLSTINKN